MKNNKNSLLIFAFFLFYLGSVSFSRVAVSVDTFYTLPGVSFNISNYEINNSYSNYVSFGLGFPYAKAEIGQLWKLGDSYFRLGAVEGVESSFIIQGYYFGPAVEYDFSNNLTFRVYGGAMYANSPFGNVMATAIVNAMTGSNQNVEIGYQWIGMGGASLTAYF